MKLIFVLSQNSLDLYGSKVEFEHLIDYIDSFEERLNLNDNFMTFWQKHYDTTIQNAAQIELQIQSKASFSNTRVVSVWCRTWAMFQNKPFEISNDKSNHKSISETANELDNQTNIKTKNEIKYSGNPTIGKKKNT